MVPTTFSRDYSILYILPFDVEMKTSSLGTAWTHCTVVVAPPP